MGCQFVFKNTKKVRLNRRKGRMTSKFRHKVELIKIDDCGHVPHQELPTEFVCHLRLFLVKLLGGVDTSSDKKQDCDREGKFE